MRKPNGSDAGGRPAKRFRWNIGMKIFQDTGHLFRVAAVFLVGFVAFLVLRSLLVPRSFGRYGHYRAKP